MKGTIFSIEEFAVHDGTGVRINVFFKGCPLRCRWCHNPEGWTPEPKIVKNPNGCVGCGACSGVCKYKDTGCVLCKQCIYNCPMDLIRISGDVWEAEDLANKLLSYEDLLKACNGGLTFSGGEVLMQWQFLCEILDKTKKLHRIIETSGFGSEQGFNEVLKRIDFAFYDLKIMDSKKHEQYTGASNEIILKNAKSLMNSGVPFAVRVPLINEVNCDSENMIATCEFVKDAKELQYIELLPYNEMAGSKYALAGLEYEYTHFTRPNAETLEALRKIVESYGIECKVRGTTK